MSASTRTPLRVVVAVEDWPLKRPFRITGHTFLSSPVVHVRLEDGRIHCGDEVWGGGSASPARATAAT